MESFVCLEGCSDLSWSWSMRHYIALLPAFWDSPEWLVVLPAGQKSFDFPHRPITFFPPNHPALPHHVSCAVVTQQGITCSYYMLLLPIINEGYKNVWVDTLQFLGRRLLVSEYLFTGGAFCPLPLCGAHIRFSWIPTFLQLWVTSTPERAIHYSSIRVGGWGGESGGLGWHLLAPFSQTTYFLGLKLLSDPRNLGPHSGYHPF